MTPRWLHWPTSAASAWSPSDLADLAAWYDASDSDTVFDATTGGSLPADGSAVARLEDKSGANHHLTQSTSTWRPVRQTNEVNSLDVLEFASSSNVLTTVSGTAPFGTSLTEYTCICVVKTRAGSLSDDSIWTIDAQAGLVLSNGATRFDTSNTSRSTSTTGLVSAGTAYVFGFEYHGSNDVQKTRIDGESINDLAPASVPTTASTNATFQLGLAGFNRQYTFDGMFCELVFCDALLTASNREKLEGYLAHKWGLSSSLPTGHPYKASAP